MLSFCSGGVGNSLSSQRTADQAWGVWGLADLSLSISVGKYSNRASKSPSASCYFLMRLLADLICLGFAPWESSPGLFNSSLTLVQSFSEFSSYFLSHLLIICGFAQRMQKNTPCFCLNLESLLPLSHFFPVECELQKCVISLAW